MVEGPGATRNGRKVQLAVGKTVVDTPFVSEALLDSLVPPTLPSRLVGELDRYTLEEAFTVGKELFLIFTDACIDTLGSNTEANSTSVALRLHFGMNGSLHARKVKSTNLDKKPSGVAPWKQNNDPSLRLYLIDGRNQSGCTSNASNNYTVVEAWDTTVTFPVSATNSRDKFISHSSRDACSTLFNAQNVYTAIRQSENLIVSDALLNQDIFPGVGNIIKIESLHLSRIDPRRLVRSLSDVELRRLIRHARKYSMDWFKTGRAGTKLVYNQTTCGTCHGMTVKMQKIGGAGSDGDNNNTGKGHAFMSRVTFWCTVCQPLNVNEGNTTTSTANAGHRNIMGNAANTAGVNRPGRGQCPQHGQRSMKLCRVRKGGQNTLRIFFTCKRGCSYFEWADGSFSSCKCGKKAILRVSKTERSGGRWFLCCASGDKSNKGNGSNSNGCGHFEWAKDEQMAPLLSLLTPLL